MQQNPLRFVSAMQVVAADGPITIRAAVEADLDGMAEVEASAYTAPWSRDSLAHELNHPLSTVLVACHRERGLVGHICGWSIVDSFHLHNLTVAARAQAMGLGSFMIDVLHTLVMRAMLQHVELEVRASNVQAIRFYRHHGYRAVAIREAYYRNPSEDAILMTYDAANHS